MVIATFFPHVIFCETRLIYMGVLHRVQCIYPGLESTGISMLPFLLAPCLSALDDEVHSPLRLHETRQISEPSLMSPASQCNLCSCVGGSGHLWCCYQITNISALSWGLMGHSAPSTGEGRRTCSGEMLCTQGTQMVNQKPFLIKHVFLRSLTSL